MTNRHIPAAIRRSVIARDGLNCQRCGSPVVAGARGPQALHLDHVEHWAAGGPHTLENLIVCCQRCNLTRPKPTRIVRSARYNVVQQRGDRWYWVDGYAPPDPLEDAPHPFDWVYQYVQITPFKLVQLIETGVFRATEFGPIYVLMSESFETRLREIEERRRADARRRSNEAFKTPGRRALRNANS